MPVCFFYTSDDYSGSDYDCIAFNFFLRDLVSIECVYANKTPHKEIKTNIDIFCSTHIMYMLVE